MPSSPSQRIEALERRVYRYKDITSGAIQRPGPAVSGRTGAEDRITVGETPTAPIIGGGYTRVGEYTT